MKDSGSFLRHFGIVLSGAAVGQVINLASYPIIARLYSPADFGFFALFLALSSVPGIISCWRFELVIPTTTRRSYVAAYWLSVSFSLVSGVIAGLCVTLLSFSISSGWSPFLPLLVGVAVSLTGFAAASNLFLLRQDGYRITSLSIVVRTSVVVASQILLTRWWPNSFGLILGYCLGFVIQVTVLGVAISKRMPARPRLKHLLLVFRRHRRQVAIDVPSTLMGGLSINLMAPLLILLFSNSAAGIYALAVRIAVVPMQVFNDAVSQVFFQKAARAQESRGGFWPEFRFSLLVSGAVAIGVVAILMLFAPPFVILYLGAEWSGSATVLTILAPMLGLSSVCMSLATTVFVLRRVHWLLFLNLATVTAQLMSFGIARQFALSFPAFLTLVSALLGGIYFVFILCMVRAVKRNESPDSGLPPRREEVVEWR